MDFATRSPVRSRAALRLKGRGFAYVPATRLGPQSNKGDPLSKPVTTIAYAHVQEYQPAIHRLRLSASP